MQTGRKFAEMSLTLRVILPLAILALALVALPALAQSSDEDAAEEQADDAVVETTMMDFESIVMLEFNTYDTGWVRYRNYRGGLFPLLDVADIAQFPFITYGLDERVSLSDLGSSEFLTALFEADGLAYDEEMTQGNCDTARLSEYGDILCVPGTSAMPPGYVISAIYHPESHEILALTTSIDNIDSIATRADEWRGAQPAQPAAAAAAPASAPAQSGGDQGCGPWVPGQWITVAQYQASGLSLPIVEGVVVGQATDYQCMVAPDGQVYLEAYTVVKSGSGSGSSTAASGDGVGGGDGGGDDGTCKPGDPGYQPGYNPGDPPICY